MQLESDFPEVPTAHIRAVMTINNSLYAPAYLALRVQQRTVPLPYRPLARARSKGKGKRVQRRDEELEAEIRWVQETLEEEEVQHATQVAEAEAEEEEGGIECGCCFTDYPFVSVPARHLTFHPSLVSPTHRTRWYSAPRLICSV